MNEIAQMTYSQNEFIEVMEMLDKRLNDKGKNWRHVFKVRSDLTRREM
jgi:epsin